MTSLLRPKKLRSVNVFSFFVSITTISFSLFPALASEPIRNISFEAGTGKLGRVEKIKVYQQIGFTVINFRKALGENEKIRQITVGDGSFLQISSDDPTCISNDGHSSSNRACTATIIYLQLDRDWGEIARITRLTIATESNFFLFDLVPAKKGTPKLVYILPPPQQYSRGTMVTLAQIENLHLGYAEAQKKGILTPELAGRIQNFLYYVRLGKDLTTAAREAGISMNVVRKLDSLGIANSARQSREIEGAGSYER